MFMGFMKGLRRFLPCLFIGVVLSACGGGGDGDSVGQGTLSTYLTDSSTDEYQAVYVTIARVDVHHDVDGTWETVAEPNKTYNLLELVNGVRETLGIASLDTGHYTQMRLIIGETPEAGTLNMFSTLHPYPNYIINLADEIHELKVPSGTNTGLKIVNGFDINEDQTTELILDFDASRSVVRAGSKDKYLLMPTAKVLNTANYAIVSGMVKDIPPTTDPPTEASPLSGAMVTAQTTPVFNDVKYEVVIEAGTVAAGSGEYKLFLAPGDYNLIATQYGYLPACAAATLHKDSTTPLVDFQLDTSENMGNVVGTVTIEAIPGDQFSTIDFRKTQDCGNGMTTITVKTLNISDGGEYFVDLPTGDYTFVVSTYEEITMTTPVTVGSEPQTVNFNFVPQ